VVAAEVAVLGPALLARTVNVTRSPTRAVSRLASFVTLTSSSCVTATDASAWSLPPFGSS